MTYIIIYSVLSVLHGVHAIIRQTQRWSGNSYMRLMSVFLINSIGFPICLLISLYLGTFLHDGKQPVAIEEE